MWSHVDPLLARGTNVSGPMVVLTFCLGTLGESRAQEPLRQTEVVLIDHPDGEVLAALREYSGHKSSCL